MTDNKKQAYFLYKPRRSESGSKAGIFILQFLEMQIPMALGALVCYLLARLVPPTSRFATIYHPGTYLFAVGDMLYLSIPVLIWMIFRGHSRRDSLGMAVAMVAPVTAIMALGTLTEYDFLTGLLTAGYPAMSIGMLAYMFYRRDHFAG